MATQRASAKKSDKPAPGSLIMFESPLWKFAHRAMTISGDGTMVTALCGVRSRLGNRQLGEFCKRCEALNRPKVVA